MDTKSNVEASAQIPAPAPPAPAQVAPMPRLITAQEAARTPRHKLFMGGFFRERELRPGKEPSRAVTGRHTLGSPPESQEPPDPAVLPVLPTLPPLENLTEGAEPVRTIYVPTWYEARRRLLAVRDETRGPLTDLLDLCETAWHDLRDLQHWAEANEARSNEADAYGCLLTFVDADLVDVFRDLAGGISDLVPGREGCRAVSFNMNRVN